MRQVHLNKRYIREHRQNVSGQLSGFWPLKVEGYREIRKVGLGLFSEILFTFLI